MNMEKLLILGNNINVDYLINCAKNRGIYTIVTDYLSPEKSPFKKICILFTLYHCTNLLSSCGICCNRVFEVEINCDSLYF